MSEIPRYNSFGELLNANTTNESSHHSSENMKSVSSGVTNVEFFGDPGFNAFEAEQLKELIAIREDIVRKAEQEMRLPNDPDMIRQRINKVLITLIDENKGKYADLKKALLEYGVEAISDSFHYDDHFDEKYGEAK